MDQYGVVGHPVSHSLSPFIHGMFARETGQTITYRLFDVRPADLEVHVRDFFSQGGRGLNVTLPHKIAAGELAHELTARAAHAAAVNTLASTEDGSILGDNTDGPGLVHDLCDNLGIEVAGRRVLIMGAGGATRGVLAPLLGLEPAVVVIANRTPERAAALAAAFADLGVTQGVGFADVGDEPYDLVINEAHVNAAANDTFEKSGVAKNAREEKIRARDAKIKQDAENAKMAKLYRKEVLGEPEIAGFISLGEIKAAPTAQVEVVNNIEETVSGD